jgi:hypothetical protein
MPDADDELTPATRGDIETCLSLGRTRGSSLARRQAAELKAKVVAERLVAHLERSGFVIMRKPNLFDTLLLAAVTTKPAGQWRALGPDWTSGLVYQSDDPSVRQRAALSQRARGSTVGDGALHHPPGGAWEERDAPARARATAT